MARWGRRRPRAANATFYRELEAALSRDDAPPVDPRNIVAVLEVIDTARG